MEPVLSVLVYSIGAMDVIECVMYFVAHIRGDTLQPTGSGDLETFKTAVKDTIAHAKVPVNTTLTCSQDGTLFKDQFRIDDIDEEKLDEIGRKIDTLASRINSSLVSDDNNNNIDTKTTKASELSNDDERTNVSDVTDKNNNVEVINTGKVQLDDTKQKDDNFQEQKLLGSATVQGQSNAVSSSVFIETEKSEAQESLDSAYDSLPSEHIVDAHKLRPIARDDELRRSRRKRSADNSPVANEMKQEELEVLTTIEQEEQQNIDDYVPIIYPGTRLSLTDDDLDDEYELETIPEVQSSSPEEQFDDTELRKKLDKSPIPHTGVPMTLPWGDIQNKEAQKTKGFLKSNKSLSIEESTREDVEDVRKIDEVEIFSNENTTETMALSTSYQERNDEQMIPIIEVQATSNITAEENMTTHESGLFENSSKKSKSPSIDRSIEQEFEDLLEPSGHDVPSNISDEYEHIQIDKQQHPDHQESQHSIVEEPIISKDQTFIQASAKNTTSDSSLKSYDQHTSHREPSPLVEEPDQEEDFDEIIHPGSYEETRKWMDEYQQPENDDLSEHIIKKRDISSSNSPAPEDDSLQTLSHETSEIQKSFKESRNSPNLDAMTEQDDKRVSAVQTPDEVGRKPVEEPIIYQKKINLIGITPPVTPVANKKKTNDDSKDDEESHTNQNLSNIPEEKPRHESTLRESPSDWRRSEANSSKARTNEHNTCKLQPQESECLEETEERKESRTREAKLGLDVDTQYLDDPEIKEMTDYVQKLTKARTESIDEAKSEDDVAEYYWKPPALKSWESTENIPNETYVNRQSGERKPSLAEMIIIPKTITESSEDLIVRLENEALEYQQVWGLDKPEEMNLIKRRHQKRSQSISMGVFQRQRPKILRERDRRDSIADTLIIPKTCNEEMDENALGILEKEALEYQLAWGLDKPEDMEEIQRRSSIRSQSISMGVLSRQKSKLLNRRLKRDSIAELIIVPRMSIGTIDEESLRILENEALEYQHIWGIEPPKVEEESPHKVDYNEWYHRFNDQTTSHLETTFTEDEEGELLEAAKSGPSTAEIQIKNHIFYTFSGPTEPELLTPEPPKTPARPTTPADYDNFMQKFPDQLSPEINMNDGRKSPANLEEYLERMKVTSPAPPPPSPRALTPVKPDNHPPSLEVYLQRMKSTSPAPSTPATSPGPK